MKTLYLIRHAKSDWGNPFLPDIDRPLNERGKRDAPDMAQRLLDRGAVPALLISSPARRAFRTARYFAKAFGVKKEKIRVQEELYMAGPAAFYRVIEGADEGTDSLAVFSHNPGITDFANELCNARIDNIPTCGVFVVRVYSQTWKGFREAEKEFLFFDFPKAGLISD